MVPSNGVTVNVVFRRCSGGDAAAINCLHSANTRAMICSMAPVGSIGSLEREEEDAFDSSGSIVIVAGVTDDALTVLREHECSLVRTFLPWGKELQGLRKSYFATGADNVIKIK